MSAARGALPLALAALALAACTPAPPPAAPAPTSAPASSSPPASSSAPASSTGVRFSNPPGHRFGTEVTLNSGLKLTVAAPRPLPITEVPAEERRPGTRALGVTLTMTNNGKAPVDHPDPGFSGAFVAHDSAEVVRVDGHPTRDNVRQSLQDKPIPPGGSTSAEFWVLLPDRPGVFQLKGMAHLARDEFRYEGEV